MRRHRVILGYMPEAVRKPYDVSRREAAERLGVHPETIRRWVASGILDHRRSHSGQLWFSPEDIERLRRQVNGVVEVIES